MAHEPATHYDVYLSYARLDGGEAAAALEADLSAAGFRVWRDTRALDPAEDFTAVLERQIEAARYFIACITPASRQADDFVRREISYALALNKPMLICRFADLMPPLALVSTRWIDFFSGEGRARQELFAILNELPDMDWEEPLPAAAFPEAYDELRPYLYALYKWVVGFLGSSVLRMIEIGIESVGDGERRFAGFHEAFEIYGGRVLLLGEPGTGKTVTLMKFARDAIAARLTDTHAPLPLVGLAGTWDSDTQPPPLAWILREYEDLPRTTVEALVATGRALFLLDGLDELGTTREDPHTHEIYDPRRRFLQALATLPAGNGILLTGRLRDYWQIGALLAVNGVVQLRPLTDEQLADSLRDQPELQEVILGDAALTDIIRTPALLASIAFTFRDLPGEVRALRDLRGSDLRAAIFTRYVERLAALHSLTTPAGQRVTLAAIEEALATLAVYMYMRPWEMYAAELAPLLDDTVLDFAARQFQDWLPLNAALLPILQRLNLISRDDRGGIRFITNLLRDVYGLPRLVALLRAENAALRFGAARGLGFLPQRDDQLRVIPLLRGVWHEEKDDYVRLAMVGSLQRLRARQIVFVSYRRKDWSITHLLADRLETRIDAEIFLDRSVDAADFETSLMKYLAAASVFILIVTDRTFAPERIHLEDDWVRREIRAALQHQTGIVLALVDGVSVPEARVLPADIREIVRMQGYPVQQNSLAADVDNIADFVTKIAPIRRQR